MLLLFSFLIKYCYSQDLNTYTDLRDGNIYKTCTIGNQVWMGENLRFKIEGAIPYKNINENIQHFGYLYNWKLANKVCPAGWHLPVEKEWNTTIAYLGGKNIAGGKMKLNDKKVWKDPNRMASNLSRFSAYPSGSFINGEFQSLNEAAYFWSSEAECTSAYVVFLSYLAGYADKKILVKTDMASVRCIKD